MNIIRIIYEIVSIEWHNWLVEVNMVEKLWDKSINKVHYYGWLTEWTKHKAREVGRGLTG